MKVIYYHQSSEHNALKIIKLCAYINIKKYQNMRSNMCLFIETYTITNLKKRILYFLPIWYRSILKLIFKIKKSITIILYKNKKLK